MTQQQYFLLALILSNIGSFLIGGLFIHSIYDYKTPSTGVTHLQQSEEEINDLHTLLSNLENLDTTEYVPEDYGESAVYASKNGTRYYPKNCDSGRNRIKPENIVWYTTPELAKAEGLSIAVACK